MSTPYFARFFKGFEGKLPFRKVIQANDRTLKKKAERNRGKLVWNPMKQGTFKHQSK